MTTAEELNGYYEDDGTVTGYDYERQAWVKSGRYVACGHVSVCACYGRLHAGEDA